MRIDAMKQALEALERGETKLRYEAIIAIRAAIEQAQEPVTHTLNCVCGAVWDVSPDGVEEMVHAPTPPPRQWQGLTDDEIAEVISGQFAERNYWVKITKALEAKLKEKNT